MGDYSSAEQLKTCKTGARAWIARTAKAALAVAAIGALSVHGSASRAQVPNDLISPWLVTVEGETRTRTLRVSGVAANPDGSYNLDAVYGWTDGKPAAIKAEVTQTPEGRKLTVTTPAKSVISATQSADGSFSGTFGSPNGKSKPVKLVKATGSEPAAASAAAATHFLNKDDLEKLVTGKGVQVIRKSDSAEILWNLQSGGALYGNNYTNRSRDDGEWKIRDDGGLCLQWRNSANNCYFFNRQGDKFTLHTATKRPATYDVTAIK